MTTRPTRRAWAVGASGVIVIAALVAFAADRDGDRSVALRATVDAERPPPMAPTAVPDGLAPAAALDLPLAGGAGLPTALLLYGEPGAPDPFLRGDIAVFATDTNGQQVDDTTGPDAVEVRGRRGTYTDAFAVPELGLKALRWLDEGDLFIQVVSRSFTREELVAAATALDVEDGNLVAGRPLPRDLRLVAQQSRASVPSGSAPIPLGVSGHVVSYTSPSTDAGPERHLVVGSHAGGAEVLAVLRWYYGPAARPQPVSGYAGMLASLPGSRSQSCSATDADGPRARCETTETEAFVLAWTTATGVVVLSSSGVGEADLVRSAGTVAALDDPGWQRLRRAAELRQSYRDEAESDGSRSGAETTVPAPG